MAGGGKVKYNAAAAFGASVLFPSKKQVEIRDLEKAKNTRFSFCHQFKDHESNLPL